MLGLSRPVADFDPAALQMRALRRRQRHTHSTEQITAITSAIPERVRQVLTRRRTLPARYALHLIVGLIVPLAILASYVPLEAPAAAPQSTFTSDAPAPDFVAPMAPLVLDGRADGDTPAPDSAFAAIDALPMSTLRPDLLAPQPVAATVAAETANVRGGPGSNYDKVGDLLAGARLQVLTQASGWYQARTDDGRLVWITAELLNLSADAAALVPQATIIPTAPPAKVGLVAEQGLNLRDGPSTAHIGMIKLNAGAQVDLLARYGEWFQVQTADGKVGWVLNQYLTVGAGVTDRVETVTSVPDPRPALIGRTSGKSANLRGGPNSAFAKLATLENGAQVDLLGRYQDWFKVRVSGGKVGWISSELLQVSDYIARRVPVTRDIPTLAAPKPAPRQQTAAASAPRRAAPAPAAAAGNVVAFATQFIGARYAWGGTGPDSFDCSGFTRYVYKQYGLNLPHSAEGQYSTSYGAIISNPDQLQPGDIVFFVNTYKRGISHVGLYVGGGNVVQAMSPKLGVGVASLNGGYWAEHYYGAIRPGR